MNSVDHLTDYQVIEFRRYTIKAGEREHFIQYFEAFFPEPIEQLGALALGQFAEQEDASRFLWLRGFHSTYDRPVVNSAFYFGPLWRETSNDAE
ncbi:MAG: NIPSNAP family protein [Blastocatellia bacterium]|nr:NIPSNAP family protein [Blastocatellia bacterium]